MKKTINYNGGVSMLLYKKMFTIILLLSALSQAVLAVTTGTSDGTYDFDSLGANDSGGSGFKVQGDKFVVSNALISASPILYLHLGTGGGSNQVSGSFTLKAENGSTMKTFTYGDLQMGSFSSSTTVTAFTIVFKDYSANILGTHSISSNFTVPSNGTTLVSSLSFGTSIPGGGYDLVSQIDISYTTSTPTSNFEFQSINLSNISSSVPILNASPANTLPSVPTVSEDDTDVAFADDIAIEDTDGDNQSVTLTATNGTLSITASGTTITTGDGTDDAVIAFNGTLVNVNTALDTLTFTPTANFNGTATLRMQTDDGNSGTDDDTLNITVSPVNDSPTVTGVPSDIAVTEDTASDFNLSAVTFIDVDGDSLTVTLASSTGIFTASTGGSVTVGGSGTASLTLVGTPININTFLDTPANIKYTGASNVNGDDAATFTINANDSTVNPQLGNSNIDISAVNDDPTVSGIPTDITVMEDITSNLDLSAITLTDVDSASLDIVLTITAGTGTLLASDSGGVVIAGSATGTITLSGTVTEINTFLDTASNIQYTGLSNVNGDDVTTLSFTANDGGNIGSAGGANVSLGSSNIDITATNDNPTVSTVPTDITVTEDLVSNVDLSAITLADIDSTGATFTLKLTVGAGVLSASDGGSVTVGNSGTATITLTGTPANIDTFLNTASNIAYTSASNASGDDATTLTLTANDQDGSGEVNLGSVNIDITDTPDVTVVSYDFSTNTLSVTGNGFIANTGADVDVSNIILTGEGGGVYILATSSDVEITSATSFSVLLTGTDIVEVETLLNKNGTSSEDSTTYNASFTDDFITGVTAGNTASPTNAITVTYSVPTITSATYDISTGQLVLTGTNFVKESGATNDIVANLVSITGEGGSYTLTDSANVEITNATSTTITLSATDKLSIHGILNKNGLSSSGATTYNLAVANNWMSGTPASQSIADLTLNAITVSNVAVPTITSISYDSDTGLVQVIGTNLFKKLGANNDIDVSKFTFTGGTGNATYQVTSASDVEITSSTSFSFTLSGADKTQVGALFDQIGVTSSGGSTYNIAAADDWLAGADAAIDISDGAGNAATVTINPGITSATYNATTGVLVVTATNIQANSGGSDIDASTLTFTGEGGDTYALTDTSDVNRDSVSQFTITLSGTDKAELNQMLNKNGTSSTGTTTYNLAASDDWCTNVTAGDTSDATNAMTVSNVLAPSVTSATYDAATGIVVVTGTNFLKFAGLANDINVSTFTFTAEGGETYTLTNSSDVEISSATEFSLTLSATDLAQLNQIVNKEGVSSTDATTYNLEVAEDWNKGAEASVSIVDASGNGVTVSNVALPTIASATYNASTGVVLVTATNLVKSSGATNDIDVSLLTFTGEAGATYTLVGTSDVEISSQTLFSITLDSTDKSAINNLLNKSGTSSVDATVYNLDAAEDWISGADAAVNVVDATANAITVLDTTPDAFSFTAKTSQALASLIASELVTITGISNGTLISIVNGEYEINEDNNWLTADSTIDNNDKITLRQTSSASNSTLTIASVTVGDITEDFSVTTLAAVVTPPVVIPPVITPEPTPTTQLLQSDAETIQTGINAESGGSGTEEEPFQIVFDDESGTPTTLIIKNIPDKEITFFPSSEASEYTLENAIASYNNNGTTEHAILIEGHEPTIAISFLPKAEVQFTLEGGVETKITVIDNDEQTDILVRAKANGTSQNSVTQNAIASSIESTIIGTRTTIQDDGEVIVDTPTVLSSLNNKITTQTSLDVNGDVVVSALKVRPDDSVESVALGSFTPGTEVKVQNIDGAVVVEIITDLGTQSFTIRSRR